MLQMCPIHVDHEQIKVDITMVNFDLLTEVVNQSLD